MKIRRISQHALKTHSTVLAASVAAAGIPVLIVLGGHAVFSTSVSDQPAHHGSPAAPVSVESPCFRTPQNWPGAEFGSVPTCSLRQHGFSPYRAGNTERNRPPSSVGRVLYESPCFMMRPDWSTAIDGPVPICQRVVEK